MGKRFQTRDAFTFDAATIDSTGAFLIGELERLDQDLHMPLADVTWSRDIDLREDVSIADEISSYTNSQFAAAGGASPTGKSWIGKDTTQITRMQLDIEKTANPLTLWGMEISYTIPELESAQKVGRPVDAQQIEGMKLKHNMDIDEMVYIGDPIINKAGMVNNSGVTASNVTGADWLTKSNNEILADINQLLTRVWEDSGWAIVPSDLLLPPDRWSLLASRIVSDAGNISLLTYLQNNSIANAKNGKPLDIRPLKWLSGRGADGSNRMMAYTKDSKRVRYPLVPLQRTPLEYRGIYQSTTYFGRLGVVEFVYGNTAGYADGI